MSLQSIYASPFVLGSDCNFLSFVLFYLFVVKKNCLHSFRGFSLWEFLIWGAVWCKCFLTSLQSWSWISLPSVSTVTFIMCRWTFKKNQGNSIFPDILCGLSLHSHFSVLELPPPVQHHRMEIGIHNGLITNWNIQRSTLCCTYA